MKPTIGRRARSFIEFALVAVGYLLVFFLVYWVSVRTIAGREFGDAALRGALLTQEATSDTVDFVLDIVSVASLMAALAVVATIALVRLARLTGLAAIALLIGANGSTWLLKEHLLVRPDLGLLEYTPATLNSMPSGHTTAMFSALAAVLFVLPHRARLPIATAGGVVAVAVALATMSAGWHRGGDSVAAFLVVGSWTTLAAIAVLLLADPRIDPAEPPSQPARWLGPATAGAVVLGLATALALTAATGLRESAFGQGVALFASACFVVGAATGVLLVSLRVLEVLEAPDGGVEAATTRQ